MQGQGLCQSKLWWFGKVWFDEQAIANIFALADLKKKYHVTYDLTIEDAFIVNHESKNHSSSGVQIMASMFSYYQYVIKTRRTWLKVI